MGPVHLKSPDVSPVPVTWREESTVVVSVSATPMSVLVSPPAGPSVASGVGQGLGHGAEEHTVSGEETHDDHKHQTQHVTEGVAA